MTLFLLSLSYLWFGCVWTGLPRNYLSHESVKVEEAIPHFKLELDPEKIEKLGLFQYLDPLPSTWGFCKVNSSISLYMELCVAVVFLSTQAIEWAHLSSLGMVMGQDSQHPENPDSHLHWGLN